MGVSTRAAKGSELTHNELDSNFQLITGAASAKTIATGAISADTDNGSGAGRYVLSAEGGPGSDDLATINGCQVGDHVELFAASGHTVTVKHGTGNIRLQGGIDFTLNSIYDHVKLIKVSASWFAGHGVNVPA